MHQLHTHDIRAKPIILIGMILMIDFVFKELFLL